MLLIRDNQFKLELPEIYNELYNRITLGEKDNYSQILTELIELNLKEGIEFVTSDLNLLYPLVLKEMRQDNEFQLLLYLTMGTFKEHLKNYQAPSEKIMSLIAADRNINNEIKLAM